MEMSWLVLGVVLVILTANTGAVQMKIKPKKASTPKNGRVEIMCDIEHPVTNCSFHVWYVDYYKSNPENPMDSFTLLKLDKQNNSEIFTRSRNDATLYKASYHGDGRGQCGVKLFALTPGMYFVGCRVRHETSGWTYDNMALVVQNGTGSQTGAFESSNVADFDMVNVKENKNSEPIDFSVNLTFDRECRLFLPEKGMIVAKASDRVEMTDRNHKAKWLATNSTVSVTLLDVASGGPLWCLCRDNPQSDFTEFHVKVVTVLKAPKHTNVTKLEKTNFTEGETLTATCVARYARPVAKIVWWLGGDVIRNNTDDDNVDDARMDIDPNDLTEDHRDWPWRWPWSTKSIKQVLNHVLTLNDNGKQLTCQVLHPAWNGNQQNLNISTITVNPSKENQIEKKNDTPGFDFADSNVLLIVGVLVGAILVAIVAGVVIVCKRSSRGSSPKGGDPTDRTSFIEENDLYQGHSGPRMVNNHAQGGHPSSRATIVEENDLYQAHNDPRFLNGQSSGMRASIQAENPYEELNILPCDDNPSTTASNRISPTYGNTVHYAEVILGSGSDAKPPPKNLPEACVYAQVMKRKTPNR